MVLSKLPVPGSTTKWIILGQEPNALAEGAGGDCLDILSLVYLLTFLYPSLGDGPIKIEVLSQRAFRPKNNQPTGVSAGVGGMHKSYRN